MANIALDELFQSRPSGTTIGQIYSPNASETVKVSEIVICNTSGAAATFRICVDHDGTTYDETTALYWDVSVDADTTWLWQGKIYMDENSNLAVRTSVANAFTFTGYGEVIT